MTERLDATPSDARSSLENVADTSDRAAVMTVEEALASLRRAPEGQPPEAAMTVLMERCPEVVDQLLAEISITPAQALENSESAGDDAYLLLDAALLILAHHGETRAFAPIMDFLADSHQADEVLGTTVTEDLAAILARTYDGGSLDGLKRLVEDDTAAPYVRLACLNAVHGMARLGKLPREAVVAYYAETLDRLRKPQNASIANLIVLHSANIQSPLLRPHIDRYFDDDLVGLDQTDRASIDACYADDAAQIDRQVLASHHFEDVVDYFCSWSWFASEERRVRPLRLLRELLAEQVLRLEAAQSLRAAMEGPAAFTYRRPITKVGRNDPCPCGSGKKYKKCCLQFEAS